MAAPVNLQTELRDRSRARHRSADASVRLTAPLALSSPRIYRASVAAFYHVYAALEASLDASLNPHVASIRFPEAYRAAAFRADLRHYYGASADAIISGQMSPATRAYVAEIARARPLRLIAFSYTMYSALFGGGVFIARWCKLAFRLRGGEGTAAFDFSDNISDLAAFRKRYSAAINGLVLTREEKDEMFKARIDVFDMNETIFAELRTSVEYRRRVRNVIYVLLAALVFILALLAWRYVY